MKMMSGAALLICSTGVYAQSECAPERPCAVTTDMSTGKTTVTPAETSGARPSPAHAKGADAVQNSLYVRSAGPDVLSLEETAISYFEHVVSADARFPGGGKPFDPDNVMWDRGELNDAEAAEVLDVARRLVSPGASRLDAATVKENRHQMCRELAAAVGPFAQAAAIQRSVDRDLARTKAAGKAMLDQLSDDTRASALKVISRFREDIGVNRLDWQKVAATKPEALATYHQHACADAPRANSK